MPKIVIEVPENCKGCKYLSDSEPIAETGDYSDAECFLFYKCIEEYERLPECIKAEQEGTCKK